ncbi:MAG: YqhA family protein [Candidatus Obscuribacter sp.]|nr:YqhA family protein [Candidatus Obscuribacter sp.]
MNKRFEKIIFGGRLLLLPMYLGLLLTLLVYGVRFLVHAAELVAHSLSYTDSQILITVLHLLDVIMVSHLIVMTMIGGYVLFISGSYEEDPNAVSYLPNLKWLGHIDPGALKVKLSMSILGVSSIHLLEAFVNAENVSSDELIKLVAVHLVFVVSAMAIAWVNRYAFKH